jgi:NADH dehydrogenase
MVKRILVLGGGFAGLWSAASAVRALELLGPAAGPVQVTLVNPDAFHVIRVRCYEAELAPIRVPLDSVLEPIGVHRIEGTATEIDHRRRVVAVRKPSVGNLALHYDQLILATGSALARPPIPGVQEHGFDVDTYAGASRLTAHLASLGAVTRCGRAGRWTAVVIGAGLVGIELACELRDRLRQAGGGGDPSEPVRVVLADHAPEVGSAMGSAALPAIREALAAAGVETLPQAAVRSVGVEGVTLASGERIAALTTICATGMHASPLAELLPVPRDRLGRLLVDTFLRVDGVESIFAAGDIACAVADTAGHVTVMSCQHARPMGRFTGHNAACELLGRKAERLPFDAPDYVTVLDLGAWGAVYTTGWDRAVLRASGATAKQVKREINCHRIYPPWQGGRHAILEAAAPILQAAPSISRGVALG